MFGSNYVIGHREMREMASTNRGRKNPNNTKNEVTEGPAANVLVVLVALFELQRP